MVAVVIAHNNGAAQSWGAAAGAAGGHRRGRGGSIGYNSRTSTSAAAPRTCRVEHTRQLATMGQRFRLISDGKFALDERGRDVLSFTFFCIVARPKSNRPSRPRSRSFCAVSP